MAVQSASLTHTVDPLTDLLVVAFTVHESGYRDWNDIAPDWEDIEALWEGSSSTPPLPETIVWDNNQSLTLVANTSYHYLGTDLPLGGEYAHLAVYKKRSPRPGTSAVDITWPADTFVANIIRVAATNIANVGDITSNNLVQAAVYDSITSTENDSLLIGYATAFAGTTPILDSPQADNTELFAVPEEDRLFGATVYEAATPTTKSIGFSTDTGEGPLFIGVELLATVDQQAAGTFNHSYSFEGVPSADRFVSGAFTHAYAYAGAGSADKGGIGEFLIEVDYDGAGSADKSGIGAYEFSVAYEGDGSADKGGVAAYEFSVAYEGTGSGEKGGITEYSFGVSFDGEGSKDAGGQVSIGAQVNYDARANPWYYSIYDVETWDDVAALATQWEEATYDENAWETQNPVNSEWIEIVEE